MAHRGRLNVLANVMGKRAKNIFWGFDDPNPEENRGRGDVLYHLGYSTDWTTSKKQKRAYLAVLQTRAISNLSTQSQWDAAAVSKIVVMMSIIKNR